MVAVTPPPLRHSCLCRTDLVPQCQYLSSWLFPCLLVLREMWTSLTFLLLFLFIFSDVPAGRVLAVLPPYKTTQWGGDSGFKIPLRRRGRHSQTPHEDVKWLKKELERVSNKFGRPTSPSRPRREQSSEKLTDQQADFAYYGTITVGTPCTL